MINKKHNIYILRARGADSSLIKLGYSSNIHNRINSYLSANPFTELIFTCELEHGKDLEKIIHKLHPAEAGREWYSEDLLPKLLEYLINTTYICHVDLDLSNIKYNPKAFDLLDADFKKDIITLQHSLNDLVNIIGQLNLSNIYYRYSYSQALDFSKEYLDFFSDFKNKYGVKIYEKTDFEIFSETFNKVIDFSEELKKIK